MSEKPYSKREQDEKWAEIANALSRIEIQTTTTNGRATRLEKLITVVVTAIVVLSVAKMPELLGVFRLIS